MQDLARFYFATVGTGKATPVGRSRVQRCGSGLLLKPLAKIEGPDYLSGSPRLRLSRGLYFRSPGDGKNPPTGMNAVGRSLSVALSEKAPPHD
jgi:hypothetical protein